MASLFGASANPRRRPEEDPYAPLPVAPAIGGVQPQPQMAPQTDPLAIMQALASMINPDPLGEVARSNSRPMGLTSEADWSAMFPRANQPQQTISNTTADEQAAARATTSAQSGRPIAPVSRGTEVGPRVQMDPFQQFVPDLVSGEQGPFPGVNLMQQTPYGPIAQSVPPAAPQDPRRRSPWSAFPGLIR